MKGHIRERSPGRWAIILATIGKGKRNDRTRQASRRTVLGIKFDLGTDPLTGKRRIRYVAFKGTKRAAEIELARLVSHERCW